MAKSKNKKKSSQTSQRWKMYTVTGDTVTKKPHCPRCGPGYFMAMHKNPDRYYCGNCGYTQTPQ